MIHALRHGARRAMLAATASVIALTIVVFDRAIVRV